MHFMMGKNGNVKIGKYGIAFLTACFPWSRKPGHHLCILLLKQYDQKIKIRGIPALLP